MALDVQLATVKSTHEIAPSPAARILRSKTNRFGEPTTGTRGLQVQGARCDLQVMGIDAPIDEIRLPQARDKPHESKGLVVVTGRLPVRTSGFAVHIANDERE